MTTGQSLRHWIGWMFILCCVLVISVAVSLFLFRYNILDQFQSTLAGMALFFGFIVLQRQADFSRELKTLRHHADNMTEGSVDAEKLDEFVQEVKDHVSSGTAAAAIETEKLRSELVAAELRLTTLEQSGNVLNNSVLKSDEPPESPAPKASLDPYAIEEAEAERPDNRLKQNLKAALDGDNLTMHLQPIVELPNRTPAFFEAFMRLKTGEKEYLDHPEFARFAEEGGLTSMIDKKVLFSSARMLMTLNAQKKKAGLFCKLSTSSLSDAKTFSEVINFLETNIALKSSLVLELTQRTYGRLKPAERDRLNEITALGFSLSLDQVLDLNLDTGRLAADGFRYVRVPASILLHASIDDGQDGISPTDMAGELSAHNIALAATEIARESDAIALLDFDVAYGQGSVFAPPRPVKPELLNGTHPVRPRKPAVKTLAGV